MAMVDEESICYVHAWVGPGSCPKCMKRVRDQLAAEKARWAELTVEEKLDELHELLLESMGLKSLGC